MVGARVPKCRSIRTAAALTLGSLCLAACGAGNDADVAQIRQVIHGFAEASGAQACPYLTPTALRELFASAAQHESQRRESPMAACLSQSRSFTGAPVKITRVWFQSAHAASAYAHRIDGARASYLVTLRKDTGGWQINHITH